MCIRDRWITGLLLLASAVVTGIIFYRRYRLSRLSYWLKPELQVLTTQYAENHDPVAFLQSISSLLRRACLSLYPRHAVASLTNEAWLGLLDQAGETSEFTHGAGRLLAEGPYLRNASAADVDALLPLVLNWIDHCGKLSLIHI